MTADDGRADAGPCKGSVARAAGCERLGIMETQRDSVKTIEVFVFYFDVANVVTKFRTDQSATLHNLRAFQRYARRVFPFGYAHSYVVTLYDNVWCRVNAAQPGLPSLLLNFAGSVMRAARREGFLEYFGCITRGLHEYCPEDRMLVGGTSFEDLTEQHIDITSEPHIRAAYSEKWRKLVPAASNSVWVSTEVFASSTLAAEASYPDATFTVLNGVIDLAQLPHANNRAWPFSQSKFQAIRPLETS